MTDDTPGTITRERQKAWIEQIRLATGDAYSVIATNSGLTPSTLNRFMNDHRASHSLSATTEAKIEKRYGLSPKQKSGVELVEGFSRVPLVGKVQAGLWQSDFLSQEYHADEYVQAPHDPRYPGLPRVAFRVMGDSMDRIYPQGTIVLAIRFYDLGRQPKTGEKVIFVRMTDGVEEATVKEIEVLPDGRVALWPRSTNPEHSMAVVFPNMGSLAFADDGSHPDVRVEALITQSIRLE